jgi:hypothetical protein
MTAKVKDSLSQGALMPLVRAILVEIDEKWASDM